MIVFIVTLVVVAALFGAGAGVFLMVVISIHRVDRAKRLNKNPAGHIDAATRHLLGTSGSMSVRRPEGRD